MKKHVLSFVALFCFASIKAATFTVTTTADAGAGSFRQAILDANALAGTDNITFAIGTGAQTITLLSSVNITTPMYIDGSSQPGFTGTPLITIGGVSMFNINSVNTGTLSSLGFVSNTSSTAINVNSSTNWLFVNNEATAMSIAFQLAGTNTTHTIVSNNFSGSGYGIYMNGNSNNGHVVNNNNLSSITQQALSYNYGTPASISNNTFTASNNAIYLRAANNFTLSPPGSGGPNENVFGTGGITGRQISVESCPGINVSGFNFSSQAATPLNTRSPFLINACSNGTFMNNIATGVYIAMEISGSNTTHTITGNNLSGSGYGIYMNGNSNNGHVVNNNNLSSITQQALSYNYGTPASISNNTFTASNNAIYLRAANNFTLSPPGSGGPNENVFGTGGITGRQISVESCPGINVSGFNFSSQAATPLNTRSPFLINACSNGTFMNNIATGVYIAMEISGSNTTHTITGNNLSGSGYGIYMNGNSNNGHVVNNNNLSSITQQALSYNYGTPASISNNTFTASNNAIYLRAANNFTLSPPGSGGPNENVFGTGGITGRQISVESCPGINVSGFNFSSQAATPLNTRSPFLINACSNGTFMNNIATGVYIAMEISGSNTTHTITGNNLSGSGYGIYMNGNSNNGHVVNNNNLSSITQQALSYNYGTPASISNNTFTASNNAIYLRAANNFTLSPPGSGGPNENVFGTGGITGRQISVESCPGINVSGFNFSSQAATPLNTRSPFLINACSNGTFMNNIATGVYIAMEISGSNTTHTITGNNLSGSGYGIYMNGNSNNGHVVNNNNLSSITQQALSYNYGTPASINSNTFTGSVNALYLRSASNFTLGTANVFKNQTGTSISLESCSAVNVSNNAVNGTGGQGILVNQSNNCVIDGNTTCGRSIGIRIQGSSNANTISNGSIVSCGTGILLDNTAVNNTTITAVNLFNTTNINNAGLNTVITGTTSTNTSPIISVNSGAICSGSSFTMSPSGASTYTFTGGSAVVSPTATTNYSVTGIDANGCISAVPAVSGVTVNVCAVAAALNFDGTNDYVDCGIGVTNALKGKDKLTVEAWVYPTQNTAGKSIIGNHQSNTQFNIQHTTTNQFNFFIGFGTYAVTTAANSVVLNTWQHIAGVFDDNILKFYINGVLSGTTAVSSSYVLNPSCNTNVWIGKSAFGGEEYKGSIDEVRIWDLARTQCEINTYKNCEIPTTATNLLANYHFNQGVDGGTNTGVTALTDASASAYTGTLTNMALTGTVSNWVAPGGVTSGSVTPASLTPTVNSTVTNSVICSGNSTTLSGAGANTYVWTGGVTNAVAFTPTVTDTYTVTGTNTVTGCSNTATKTVTVNTLPTVTVNSGAICAGQSFTMVPNGASTYVYSSGTNIVTPIADANYTVTGTDANGCENMTVSSVTVNALPVITSQSGNVTLCGDVSSTHSVSVAGTNTYEWYYTQIGGIDEAMIDGSYTEINYTTNVMTIQQVLTGDYDGYGVYCVITNSNNCSTTSMIDTIVANPLPIVLVNSGVICAGQSFTMVPSGADTYTYSSGTDVVAPISNATYTVTGTDANGCENTAASTVTVNALPIISVNSGAICAGQSFTMVPSGADTYTYSSGTDVVTPTSNATYTVTGTDVNGCENIAASTVTVNALPTISVNSGAICTGQSFTMVPSGADTYTYSSGTDVVTPTSDATYTVTGTDANGCENAGVSTVTVNALPTLMTMTTNTLLCTGETATLSVMGASTYTWSTTENSTDIVVNPTVQTTYTVDGTDANGCMNTTTITQDVSLCTGIATLNNTTTYINVYPNPNNGLFVIELTTVSKITVTNALGQVVIAETFEAGKHNVDIHNEATGVYFVKVLGNNKQQIIKVIKE